MKTKKKVICQTIFFDKRGYFGISVLEISRDGCV